MYKALKNLFFAIALSFVVPLHAQQTLKVKNRTQSQKHHQQDSMRRALRHLELLDTSLYEKKLKGYYAKNTVYLYYDALRQAGIGYRYSHSPSFDVNLELGYIGVNANRGYTGFNDFFDKKGISINLLPKIIVASVKGFYVGSLMTFQHMSYKNKWVEQYQGYDKYYSDFNARSDMSSNGFTLQVCVGTKHNYKWFSLETFASIGREINYEKRIWYEVNNEFRFKGIGYPYTFKDVSTQVTGTIGLKIGFNFSSKKILRRHYLPKYINPRINTPKLGLLYRNKLITKKQIHELSDNKRLIYKETSKYYNKHFLETELLIEKSNQMIDAINLFIKTNFPIE